MRQKKKAENIWRDPHSFVSACTIFDCISVCVADFEYLQASEGYHQMATDNLAKGMDDQELYQSMVKNSACKLY